MSVFQKQENKSNKQSENKYEYFVCFVFKGRYMYYELFNMKVLPLIQFIQLGIFILHDLSISWVHRF